MLRLLSAGSSGPDDVEPISSNRGSLQRRDGGSERGSSVRSLSPRHISTAEWDARQKSQALTMRIGELGKQGLWQDVIRALEAAEKNGQKLNVINFTAAIAALTRSKQPERALQLSVLLQQRDLKAAVFAYTALIDACSKGGQWQVALQLLHAMQQQGVAPNLRTYTAAIDACSKGGQ
eukprot:12576-Heterococcus_DN1.PRE.1